LQLSFSDFQGFPTFIYLCNEDHLRLLLLLASLRVDAELVRVLLLLVELCALLLLLRKLVLLLL
jgi:hypothetical protein